jgi:uncharacterized protein
MAKLYLTSFTENRRIRVNSKSTWRWKVMKLNNPFGIIADFEKGRVESSPKEIIVSLAIGISYILILVVFQMLLLLTGLASNATECVMQIGCYILFLIIILNIYRHSSCFKKESCDEINDRVSYRMFAAVMLLSLGIFFANFIVNYLTRSFVDYSRYIEFMKDGFSGSSAFLFYVCITGPICEEFVFRGIILNGMLKKFSKTKSIIVTAIIFGMIHLNVPQFIAAFVFGVFAGLLYVQSRSIIACMLLHCTYNSINMAFTLGSDYRIFDYLQQMDLITAMLIGIMGIAVIYLMFRVIKKENGKRRIVESKYKLYFKI